MTLLEIANSG